jgi:hypothetical protein
MFYGESFGQKNPDFSCNPLIYSLNRGLSFEKEGSMKSWNKSGVAILNYTTPFSFTGSFLKRNTMTLSPSFGSDHLGLFCKKELQLEKFTSMPFRFRLGSLDYVNYLERKPNATLHR